MFAEDFDTQMTLYTDDAILAVTPGQNAIGRVAIRKAFEKIAEYFKNGLQVEQNSMAIIASGDSPLILANTVVSAPGYPNVDR